MTPPMLKNYIQVALRNLLKNKVYTIINLLGLGVGIASCLLIVLFVTDQFSYDNQHSNGDRIYKIALERKYPNHITNYAIIPHSFSDVIPKDFPEVERVVKMGGPFDDVVVVYENGQDEKRFEEDFIMSADSNFFKFFDFKVIAGDPNKALQNLNDVVLTETTAKKYFDQEDPIGKNLRFFGQDFTVSAVCADLPANSHIKFNFLLKWNDQFQGGNENFTTFSAHVYLLLKKGTDPKDLEAKFPGMVDTYASGQIERDLGKSWEDYKKEGNGYRYFLQPLKKIHLDPIHLEAKIQPGGNINYIYFLISIAALVLIIACINFTNLATARSAERAREVGVRKTMGSGKNQLVAQFLTEAIVLSFLATVLAIALVYLALPAFNNLTGFPIDFHLNISIIISLIAVAVLVGTMAGSYPAFALSSFNPILVMKGNHLGSAKGAWLRNSLVVFQFFISIVLIVGTLVVYDQMRFMQNKSLGYDREKIIVVEGAFDLEEKHQTFIDELQQLPQVKAAGSTFSLLGREGDFFGAQYQAEGSSEILTTKSTGIDDDFATTIGFKFVAGRNYSKESNDSLNVILNESAVKVLGIQDPIGKKVYQVQRRPEGNVTVDFTIIGVIEDFNFQTLRDPITPLSIHSVESFGGRGGFVYVKVKDNLPEALNAIEQKWKTLAPQLPFKFQFFDQHLQMQYEAEQRAGRIFSVFSGLAILIACVGLFGLAAYLTGLRTKEIGVRKVLGASVFSVILLLSKDFTKLIIIAFILAAPLSWYVMNQWLQNFAYRIELGIAVFGIAGVLALLIAWLTVSYQSIKAATANPVRSLRSE